MKRTELFGLALVMLLAVGLGQWLRGGQAPASADQGVQLRAATQPGELLMISSVHCAHCGTAREWLKAQQVPFDECFIERNEACKQRWQQTGALATPTFVVAQKNAVLGLDAARLLPLLQAQ